MNHFRKTPSFIISSCFEITPSESTQTLKDEEKVFIADCTRNLFNHASPGLIILGFLSTKHILSFDTLQLKRTVGKE